MSDFLNNYLKYKTKYLKLKNIISAGAPIKEENAQDSSSKLFLHSIKNLEERFLRRDVELRNGMRDLMHQMNLLMDQIDKNQFEMVEEIHKLHQKIFVAESFVSSEQVKSDKKEQLLVPIDKLEVPKESLTHISSLLNSILTDKSLEGSDKLKEKIMKLDQIYAENIEICDNTDDKGLVTLLLRYACLKGDEVLIQKLFPRITMTRDFLLLMSYYKDRRNENIELFKRKVNLDKLEQTNVDFMIDKELSYLLPLLEGRFIKSSVKLDSAVSGSTLGQLKQLFIPDVEYYINKICNFTSEVGIGKEKDKLLLVECTSSQKRDRLRINALFEADNDYDVIIDGGNLMHVGGGKNVSNIIRAFRYLLSINRKPLVILYHKHTKDSSIVAELSKNKIKYIGTPASNDDDIFTLLAFLNNSKKNKPCLILTNDRYKKWFAVYKHTEMNHSVNLEGYITDALLEYRIEIDDSVHVITPILDYSNCIQVINSSIAQPTTKFGYFRVVSLQ